MYRGDRKYGKVFTDQGGSYTGNIKASKPLKGGGSVSGSWNNDGKPIVGRIPAKSFAQLNNVTTPVKEKKPVTDDPAARWRGNKYLFDYTPGFDGSYLNYRGQKKQPSYVRAPNSVSESVRVTKPDKNISAVSGLQVKVKMPSNYAKKPHAADGALKGIPASKYAKEGSTYKGFMKQPKYVVNTNSSKDALKVISPSKVNYRIADYQGNIKMHKYKSPDMHPDSKFAQSGKSNTSENKDAVTGIKLLWAKLFQKNDAQPSHLKEKIHKPRYDKREIGLWYD